MSITNDVGEKKTQNLETFDNVEIDVENLEEDFKNIQKKLDFFKTMKNGDKIMKTDCSNNQYYIVENDKYQTWKRWWYSEDRNKTISYLDNEFSNFAKYLDKVLFNLKEYNLLKYYTLALDVSRFINDLLPGLYSLKETYVNFKEMQDKVDSIITTLIDYKDQVELYKNQNKNRRQLMTNMVVKRNRFNSN